MKKSFKIGEKGKSGKETFQGSPLDIILGNDDEDKEEVSAEKADAKKPEAKLVEEKKEVKAEAKKPVVKKSKNTVSKKTVKPEKVEPQEPVDKRKVEDKKAPFSTVLRGSLQKELKEVLKEYRQKVDFEYNKAQFMEDAVIQQLNNLKKQLKK